MRSGATVLVILLLGLVCLVEGRGWKGHGRRRNCARSREALEAIESVHGPTHKSLICQSGCCGYSAFYARCCDSDEVGEIIWKDDDDWHLPHHDDDDDDHEDGRHGQKAFKVVTIVLGGVIGAVCVLAVITIICRRKMLKRRQGAVAAPVDVPSDKMKNYLAEINGDNGKGAALPEVQPVQPPAYVISGVPPPLYNNVSSQIPVPDNHAPSAPPSYSTIDLQEAAQGSTMVQVRPAEEK